MRYYSLSLFKPNTTKPFRVWTTHPNGILDPGALEIEFDVITTSYAAPHGGSTITLRGVALQDLNQAQRFGQYVGPDGKMQHGMILELKAGMQKGLPLANPAQAGTIIYGEVQQSYGSWVGTDMHIDLVIYPASYTLANPGGFVLTWLKGEQLSDALRACLSVVYPDMSLKINISNLLVAPRDMVHMCGTLEELAQVVKESTRGHYLGASYPGVDIIIQGNAVVAYDNTTAKKVTQLSFYDLIGEPTWVDRYTLQVDTVMRGDLQVNDLIEMPPSTVNAPGMIATTAKALPSSINYTPTFQGQFLITRMRHVGASRTPDGRAWITSLGCVPHSTTQNV